MNHPLAQLAANTADPILRDRLLNQIGRQSVHDQIRSCCKCDLRSKCRQPVPFQGPTPCMLAFVAEAPGPQEDLTGIPLHPEAPAGQHFATLLAGIGLKREHVCILNTTCCFPGRETKGKVQKILAPEKQHIEACRPNLEAQIRLINPRILVLMGATAIGTFFRPGTKVEKARKASLAGINIQDRELGERTIVATWHPSKLNYEPAVVHQMRADFDLVSAKLHEIAAEKLVSLFPGAREIASMTYEQVCQITAGIFCALLQAVPPTMRQHHFYRMLAQVLSGKMNPHHLRALYDDAFARMCGVFDLPEPVPIPPVENEFEQALEML